MITQPIKSQRGSTPLKQAEGSKKVQRMFNLIQKLAEKNSLWGLRLLKGFPQSKKVAHKGSDTNKGLMRVEQS